MTLLGLSIRSRFEPAEHALRSAFSGLLDTIHRNISSRSLSAHDIPEFLDVSGGIRNGRSMREGYQRGWGLQYGNLRSKIFRDPIYRHASQLAMGRTIQEDPCRMNLFLLLKLYVPKLPGARSIIEFGSYRGGSAIFIATVCRELGLPIQVYALDTFAGMPSVDKRVDAHADNDFGDIDFEQLVDFARQHSISNLQFVRGRFEDTAPNLLPKIAPIALAHIDCDIRSAVEVSYEMVKPFMASGGYLVFDDCGFSSCLGATEAAEDLLVRRDTMNAEQVWPHWVFRSGL